MFQVGDLGVLVFQRLANKISFKNWDAATATVQLDNLWRARGFLKAENMCEEQ